jgi:hypothetical protein
LQVASCLSAPEFNLQLSTCNFQPATFNLQLSTCNFQPATFNLQLSTCNFQPATFNLQPATASGPVSVASLPLGVFALNPGGKALSHAAASVEIPPLDVSRI